MKSEGNEVIYFYKCDVEFTGRGVTVTGPNGNSIFIAAAGRRDGYRFGQFGYYWTGTFNEKMRPLACFLAWMKIMSFGSVLQNWTDVSQFLYVL